MPLSPLTTDITAIQTGASIVSVPGSFTQRTTQEIKLVIPTVTNAATFTFAILDADGATRYNMSGIEKATTTIILISRLVKPGYSFSVTPSIATGTAITVSIYPDYGSVL